MARPAGYSSEEDFSDDGLSFGCDQLKKNKFILKKEDEEIDENEKFILAVIDNEIDLVKKQIDQDKLNHKCKKHGYWTPLMHACFLANVEMVDLLLCNGADIKDHYQLVTALHCVCDSRSDDETTLIKCADLLLKNGAAINAKDWYNLSPLSYAVKKNREKLVLHLVSVGCEVNCEDTDGWTPIYYAVDKGYTNMVQILKDSGASIDKLDHKGRTLYDLATTKYHKEIAEMVNTKEKLVDIDDIINKFRDYKRLSNFQSILAELPDKSKGRFHGFPKDAARWVHGIGLETQVKQFLDKGIQLGQLLTMDESELKEIGVEFSFYRKKIVCCALNFHEHSWGKHCLKGFDKDFNLFYAAQFICNVIRQVHLISMASFFWRKHKGHLTTQKDFVIKGLYYTRCIKREVNTIVKLLHELEKTGETVPCDLILPQNNIKSSSIKKKTVVITCVLVVGIFCVGKYFPIKWPSVNQSFNSFKL